MDAVVTRAAGVDPPRSRRQTAALAGAEDPRGLLRLAVLELRLLLTEGGLKLFLEREYGAATEVTTIPLSADGTQLAAPAQSFFFDAFPSSADEPMGREDPLLFAGPVGERRLAAPGDVLDTVASGERGEVGRRPVGPGAA